MGGSVPAGLPNHFGIGADDKFDDYAPYGPHKWKDGQGSTCWDYSYVYMVPEWRGWVSPDGEWAKRELQAWEARGQIQVFTFYYSYGSPAYFTNATNMATYWSDLSRAFQLSAQYTTRRVIFHFEPDGIGFWRNNGVNPATAGSVIVGGATSPTGGNVNGLPWNTTNFPNSLQGWSKAIYHLRQHWENQYGGSRKILLAHHYTHWATGWDVMVNPDSAANVTNHVNNMADYMLNIENGLNFDLFFADPADRDADFWYIHSCGTPSNQSRWARNDYNYTWGTRSWGTEAYIYNAVSNRMARRGFAWQVPVGNTYMRTTNNSNGHYRDNRVQSFLPSASYNGASGVPGDAISSSSTTSGPGFWAQHGLIGVLFGSGGYETTPSPCNGGGNLLTHQRDRMSDSAVPGTNANAGYVGAGGYSTWGQSNPTNAADDDGGYLRSATARYCTVGKYPLGPVPSPTRTITPCVACTPTFTLTPTPAPADCPLILNSGQTLTVNGTWSGGNATRSSAAFTGSTGNALRVQITTPLAYNAQIANLSAFTPSVLGGYARMSMKVYVDPASLPWSGASTYREFRVRATSSASAKYEVTLGSADVPLVSGINNVSFDLTLPGGAAIGPADIISTLHFILNQDGQQAGVLFIDEITLHTDLACPPTPTRTRTPFGSPTFTPTRTQTPADCPLLFNGGQTLTENGFWAGTNATRSVGLYSGSTGNALRVQITTPLAYNNQIANLDSFTPQNWNQFTRMTLKVYVDPANLPWTGLSTYHRIRLRGSSSISGKYEADFGTTDVDLVSGLNQVEFVFGWPGGGSGFLPTDVIDRLYFITNQDGQQAGVIYLDEITLHTDAVCPPPTATSTVTRTATRTATPSATPSRTATRTATPSVTRTATPSVTPLADTPTFTATRTSTSTASPSRTATPSASPTRTASPLADTPTFTATRSSTATFSPTRTATPTSTLTRTGTPSPSRTVTPSITLTFTEVPVGSTATSTSTVTPSSTPSPTRSSTPTATSSSTFGPSATPSETPLGPLTPTPSDTPVPPSATATVSSTATRTVTPSATPTATGTSTATPSITLTATDVPPGSTLTATPTVSPTFTALPADTATFTPLPTASSTTVPPPPTGTATPSVTPTRTPTATASATPTTVVFSPTFTPVVPVVLAPPSGSADVAFSLGVSGSNFLNGAVVWLDSTAYSTTFVSPTSLNVSFPSGLPAGAYSLTVINPGGFQSAPQSLVIAGPAATATHAPGPLEFEDHRAWPNPIMGTQIDNARVAVKLKGAADGLTVKIYTRAMTAVGALELGPHGPGWQHLRLPDEFLQSAGNGTYFYVVSGRRGQSKTVQDAIGRITVIR